MGREEARQVASEPLTWAVRAGRARPAVAWGGAAIAGALLVLAWRPGAPLPVLLVTAVALYVLGPFWTPARYTLDDGGVERATPFGRTHLRWDRIAGFEVRLERRTALLFPAGRGIARFLPPFVLFWEPGANAPAFGRQLAERLADRLGERRSGA